MPGAYYTKTKEQHPVFHLFEECPAGSKIEKKDRVDKLQKHNLCKDCIELVFEAGKAAGAKEQAPPLPRVAPIGTNHPGS